MTTSSRSRQPSKSLSPRLINASNASSILSRPAFMLMPSPSASGLSANNTNAAATSSRYQWGQPHAHNVRARRRGRTETAPLSPASLPRLMRPVPRSYVSQPGRSIVHLKAVRVARLLSASYLACMYGPMTVQIWSECFTSMFVWVGPCQKRPLQMTVATHITRRAAAAVPHIERGEHDEARLGAPDELDRVKHLEGAHVVDLPEAVRAVVVAGAGCEVDDVLALEDVAPCVRVVVLETAHERRRARRCDLPRVGGVPDDGGDLGVWAVGQQTCEAEGGLWRVSLVVGI